MKKMKKTLLNAMVMLICIAAFFACGDADDPSEGRPYDPSTPVKLTTFYPDSGVYRQNVLLTGENLGTDPSIIRVYFNQKQAPVIGSTGSLMYVTAPRLPGDTCVISVVVGADSMSYPGFFKYKSSVTCTTIAGNGMTNGYQDGNLSNSILRPAYIALDKEGHIFLTQKQEINADVTNYNHHITRIDEQNNQLITLVRNVVCHVMCVDPQTGVVTYPSETGGMIITLDPKDYWAPKYHTVRWKDPSQAPAQRIMACLVSSPDDGYLYSKLNSGEVIKINPKTYEAETIYKMPAGSALGMTFRPGEPNILYIVSRAYAGVNANSVCRLDVTDPEGTFMRLSGSTAAGFRNGPIDVAQFNDPRMAFSDADGNIYVADAGNHCIRRITPQNMVETVLGMPGTPGWKDGGKDEALFNTPLGLGIASDGTVYVADWGNGRVRKIAIN